MMAVVYLVMCPPDENREPVITKNAKQAPPAHPYPHLCSADLIRLWNSRVSMRDWCAR